MGKITFIASVRCDIRDIEVIARFLAGQKISLGTRSKVASRGIRILANIIRGDQPKRSYSEALQSLVSMGYESRKEDRYAQALAKEILAEQSESGLLRQIKKFQKQKQEQGFSESFEVPKDLEEE